MLIFIGLVQPHRKKSPLPMEILFEVSQARLVYESFQGENYLALRYQEGLCPTSECKALWYALLNEAKAKNCGRWFVDQTAMTTLPAAVEWAEREWLPHTRDTLSLLPRIAIMQAENLFSQTEAEKLARKAVASTKGQIRISFFAKEQEALQWLVRLSSAQEAG